jgi:hypothetical protein
MEEVLKIALVRQPTPIVWEEPDDAAAPAALDSPPAGEDQVVTH